jgi:hypothetical protein
VEFPQNPNGCLLLQKISRLKETTQKKETYFISLFIFFPFSCVLEYGGDEFTLVKHNEKMLFYVLAGKDHCHNYVGCLNSLNFVLGSQPKGERISICIAVIPFSWATIRGKR